MTLIVSLGISSWFRPVWSSSGDWWIWLWCEILGLCWDGPVSAGLQIPAALWVVCRTSTQLLNMCFIGFMQTSSTLTSFMCAKVYTHTQTHARLLSFNEPNAYSVTSSHFHAKWGFEKQMVELCGCLSVCICVYSAFNWGRHQRLNSFLVLGTSGLSWIRLPLINQKCTLHLMWLRCDSRSLFDLLSWASFRKLSCWDPLFLFPDPQRPLMSSVN